MNKYKVSVAAVLILFGAVALPARGNVSTLIAGSDANVAAGTVFAANTGLVINVFSGMQGVLDFSLSSIPTYAKISSATFSFDETSEANSSGLVSINGYSRTGSIVAGDATAAATLLDTYSSVSLGIGLQTVPLNSAAVSEFQSLLGGTSDLGLRLTSAAADTNTSDGSNEQSSFYTLPSLAVTYSVPEPASLGMLGIIGLTALRRRPSRQPR